MNFLWAPCNRNVKFGDIIALEYCISINNNLNCRKVTPVVQGGYSKIRKSLCVTFDQDCTYYMYSYSISCIFRWCHIVKIA